MCYVLHDVCVSTQKRNDPNIATQAEAEVGSTAWSKAGNKHGWKDKWKCNAFVADMIEAAGHDYPERSVHDRGSRSRLVREVSLLLTAVYM